MVDLIRTAWNMDADKVLGGPNWLELDRFELTAKVPEDATADSVRPILQGILKDRFHLALHEDTKGVPTWVLSAGRNPKLKEADGSGESGCKPQSTAPANAGPGERMGVIGVPGPSGQPVQISIGSDGIILYNCRKSAWRSSPTVCGE
jgi:uncharacterized protein (TIGR03435 family)